MRFVQSLKDRTVSWRRLPRTFGVVGSAYLLAVGMMIVVALMTIAVGYFAMRTNDTIHHLRHAGDADQALVSELDTLRQTQRSLLVTVLFDPRVDLGQDKTALEAVSQRLAVLVTQAETLDGRNKAFAAQVTSLIALVKQATASDGDLNALRAQHVLREYFERSENFGRELRTSRQLRTAATQAGLEEIASIGDRLTWTVGVLALVLLFVGIPATILSLTRLARRINGVTRTMHRIADCQSAVEVPSTIDADEVGDLARAVQAFKRSTIALQRNSDQITRMNGWFDLALNNINTGLSIFDHNQRLVMCNERYKEIYDLPDDLVRSGTLFSDILQRWLELTTAPDQNLQPVDVDMVMESHLAAVAKGDEFVRARTLPNGRLIVVSYRPSPDGGWVDVHEDVTDRMQTDETLKRMAQTDPLTELMNRQCFMEVLSGQLSDRTKTDHVAVFLIDMAKFKSINEAYGLKVGDEVLQIVASRLKNLVTDGKNLARLNGDGFGIVASCGGKLGAAAFAAEVSAVLSGCVAVDGHRIELNIRIGVAVAPEDGDTIGQLMQRAEMALYQAKIQGNTGVVLFEPTLENTLRERQALESDLRAAYDLGQLELHYQPIMDFKTRQVASMEALMRWRHPVRGMVPPGLFIPIAEEMGLIVKLGEWAMEQACRDALSWPEHVRVAVNLSAAQFQNGDIHSIAASALRKAGLSPKRLELEVTESLLLRDEARTRRSLRRLKAMGIRIALDDFGTGYASLSYLRSFPFDKIKIDQTFVRDLPRDADCNAIVRSVVALARMLGMRTVAEGIETGQHLDQVIAAGCDEIQGYYLSRPVPGDAVSRVIAECENRLAEAA